MTQLPTIHLKTRSITFDDRLQQVRVIHRTRPSKRSASMFSGGWPTGKIEFLNYNDDKGFYYMKKYRPKEWMKVINM